MFDLKTAMTVVGIVVGVAVLVVMGDLLGNIFGRARLAIIMGAISLIAIVAFVIYVAILLAVFK
jgi:multisubunit Na+/H+ antiporter MnhE subunit